MSTGRTVMLSQSLRFLRFPRVSMFGAYYFVHSILICMNVADEAHKNDPAFHGFRRQLFHSSITAVLESLKPHMTKPAVTLCPDGHFRRVVYGLGPYIADYPEQVLLTCVVQGWCPW